VDGTLIEVWASHKSFKRKDDASGTPPGRNPEVDFNGQERCNDGREDEALEMARQLDQINRERRSIEAETREQALAAMAEPSAASGAAVCVFDESWHQGVVGLVASRLKEEFWRPTLAFAPAGDDEIRVSGRSIPDVHLRDALDLVSKRHPSLIRKFGGHAMAAGLTLGRVDFPLFVKASDAAMRELTGRDAFELLIEADGSLESGYANAEVAGMQRQV